MGGATECFVPFVEEADLVALRNGLILRRTSYGTSIAGPIGARNRKQTSCGSTFSVSRTTLFPRK